MRTQNDIKLIRQACFIDCEKAFDSIDHNVLLQKLYAYGFRGAIYDSIDVYLKRMHYNFWAIKKSTPLKIFTKVPQRSVSRYFLFSIYINDLPE